MITIDTLPPFRFLIEGEASKPGDIVILNETTIDKLLACINANHTTIVPRYNGYKATILTEETSGRKPDFYKNWGTGARVLRFCEEKDEFSYSKWKVLSGKINVASQSPKIEEKLPKSKTTAPACTPTSACWEANYYTDNHVKPYSFSKKPNKTASAPLPLP